MKFFFTRLFKKSSNKNQPSNSIEVNPEVLTILPKEEEAIAAFQMKLWCDKNLSPVAWARIILRNLPYFNSKGFSLAQLQNPPAGLILNPETFTLLKDTIERVYNVKYFESQKTFV